MFPPPGDGFAIDERRNPRLIAALLDSQEHLSLAVDGPHGAGIVVPLDAAAGRLQLPAYLVDALGRE
jgi:hypothetical protein